MDERTIFDSALDRKDPRERAEFLKKACGPDAELRARVESLLRAHDADDSFLQGAAGQLVPTEIPSRIEQPGDTIGPYKLLQQIGEGGMGVVYMAEQKEPVKRRVALKIIKPGMDTRQVIARFEAERQALAMMDHPNIAKVLDVGTTESGRPYFVMGLVNGLPVTKFCDEQRLTPKERLELFIPICQAVQHAHQKGIIHRDLKPSNILVATYDNKAVPKIIDFGVAKATTHTLTEKTMFTQLGQVVGTLEYMSPEQAQRNQLDVDTRSDIYSLGVVLYEMLTGEPPFDGARLRSAAFDEMLRIIHAEEPSRPSLKVSSSQSLPSIAANRRVEPAKLGKMIRGELDWIVLKAMEKDRGRRYETANEFVSDVQRYLADEPVKARPASMSYRFGKFVRRNRVPVFAAVLVLACLMAGVAGTTWQAIRAKAAEAEALAAWEAESLRRREADEQRKTANAVVEFLVEDLLGSAAPEETLGREVTVDEVLMNAEREIETAFKDQPVVEVTLRIVLSKTYSRLGQYEAAHSHAQRAYQLAQESLDTAAPVRLQAMRRLASTLRDQGKLKEARTLAEQAQNLSLEMLGEEHPDTLSSMHNLACALQDQGQYADAQKLQQKALDIKRRVLGEEHPSTLSSMMGLANILEDQGRYADAQKLQQKTLEINRRVLGEEHPDTLKSMSSLANALELLGQHAEARKLYERTLEIKRRVLGEEHPQTLNSMNNLAVILRSQGQHADAQRLLEETLKIERRVLGEEHPGTLRSMYNLALSLHDQDRYADAQKLYEKTLPIERRVIGDEHPQTLRSTYALALALHQQGRYADALKLLEEALDTANRTLGPTHPDTLIYQSALSHRKWQMGLRTRNRQQAAQLLREAITLQPDRGYLQLDLGKVLRYWMAGGPPDDAKAIQHFRDTLKVDPEQADTAKQLALALLTAEDRSLRNTEEAIHWANVEIEEHSSAAAWATLGLAHFRAEHWEQAQEHFRTARQAGGSTGMPLNLFLGLCAHYLGQHEQASSLFALALTRFRLILQETGDPPFGRLFVEDYVEAVQIVEASDRRAEATEPSAEQLLCEGLAHRYAGREDAAIASFQEGLKQDDSSPWLHDQLARLYTIASSDSLRDFELAQAHATQAKERYESKKFVTWTSHGLSRLAAGEIQEAIEAFRYWRAWHCHIPMEPLRELYREKYAEYTERVEAGDWGKAKLALRYMTLLETESSHLRTSLGIRTRVAADRSDATTKIRHFQVALAIGRFFAPHDQLSRIYSVSLVPSQQDPDKALFHAEKAIELYRGEPDAYVWATLGMAHYRAGRWKEALNAFEKSRQSDKKKPGLPLRLYMALCNHRTDQVMEAKQLWEAFDSTEALHQYYAADLEEAQLLFSEFATDSKATGTEQRSTANSSP